MRDEARLEYLRQGYQTIEQVADAIGEPVIVARTRLAFHMLHGLRVEVLPHGTSVWTCQLIRVRRGFVPAVPSREAEGHRAGVVGRQCEDLGCDVCQDSVLPEGSWYGNARL